MPEATASHESVAAGETASIENTQSAPLSISLVCENGCKVDLELAPGQVLGFAAGAANATLILHQGDPSHLRVIKPGTAT